MFTMLAFSLSSFSGVTSHGDPSPTLAHRHRVQCYNGGGEFLKLALNSTDQKIKTDFPC